MAFSRNPLGHPITDLEDLVAGAGMDFKYGAISDGATYEYEYCFTSRLQVYNYDAIVISCHLVV